MIVASVHSLRSALALLAVLALTGCCTGLHHLAIANGNLLRVLDADSGRSVSEVTRYQEVTRLGYRPDGERLAVGVCAGGNRVVELTPGTYAEQAETITADSCPGDVTYSPDSQSLAATTPVRPSPSDALLGNLRIAGPEALDRELGLPLPAVAYRPGGQELAVATPTGITIIGTSPGYPQQASVPGIQALALAYTTDGGRLIAGTSTGFVVLDATQSYAAGTPDTGAVIDVAVAQSGAWVALVRSGSVSIRRANDLVEVASITSTNGFRSADFSRDGALLAVGETKDSVRVFRSPTWAEQPPLAAAGRVDAVAFRPRDVASRLPVLFIHGAASGVGTTWFEPGTGTSIAAALATNPQLPIDAFYVDMPGHGGGQNETRTIEEDAQDILAMIEGGLDSAGRTQVGILNMPAYASAGRVAIVGYSLGTVSARYYLKNLMGSRRNGAITLSEFVALASPNHGIASAFLVGCDVADQPDRIGRQLCAGRTATLASAIAACGCGRLSTPADFTSNQAGDLTFLETLNGHPLADSCRATPAAAGEAPSSRPTTAAGVLYASFYADGNADLIVGGHTQTADCLGRKLARNLAPDAVNREITGVPGGVLNVDTHTNFPHHWPTICMALRTVTDHAVPADQTAACTGLTQP